MIRSQPQLSDAVLSFLHAEAARLAHEAGVGVPELRLVNTALQESQGQRLNDVLPIWTKLYISLNPKEQTFALAAHLASKVNRPSQIKQIVTICLICIFLILPSPWLASWLKFPPLIMLLTAIATVVFAVGIYMASKQQIRANFLAAVNLAGDIGSGESYVLKRQALGAGDDPLEAEVTPKRYANWFYRACVPTENRSAI